MVSTTPMLTRWTLMGGLMPNPKRTMERRMRARVTKKKAEWARVNPAAAVVDAPAARVAEARVDRVAKVEAATAAIAS